MHAGGVLGSCLPGLQCVQAHACHNGREPPPEVFDPIGSRTADAQPRILHGFVGLREGAQHPIGDRPKVRAMLFETFDKPVAFVHRRFWSPLLCTTGERVSM
jgi:hypothetical protein